ncbi:hypothetical protein PNP85_11030 [Halobacterium salinarum]|uniref:hypothetical protein n=1 Tax=Halobacterium salinarum TaxID=2242 RepID=UPI0025559269|nr:hypothetical protein [Halobacterium salinarum]MDL0140036.1 hypothetical protein [Halobacterium salinarum]
MQRLHHDPHEADQAVARGVGLPVAAHGCDRLGVAEDGDREHQRDDYPDERKQHRDHDECEADDAEPGADAYGRPAGNHARDQKHSHHGRERDPDGGTHHPVGGHRRHPVPPLRVHSVGLFADPSGVIRAAAARRDRVASAAATAVRIVAAVGHHAGAFDVL